MPLVRRLSPVIAAAMLMGMLGFLPFAQPSAAAAENHGGLIFTVTDPATYRLEPIRMTYGDAPLNFASAIEQAASASGDTIDLTGATYASNNERCATISSAGVLTIHNVGVTTVTATLAGGAGTVSGLVNVNPYNLTGSDEAAIAAIPAQNYTGSAVRPALTVTVGETTLEAGVDYTASYVNNVDVGEATAIANGVGNFTGNVSTTFEIVGSGGSDGPSAPTPPDNPTLARVWRLYNPYSGWHLYTESLNEYDTLALDGWLQEGVAWYAPDAGPDIYRLYNPYTGWHFYTENAAERDELAVLGWLPEGVAFHSAPETGIPVYRLYNPGNGLHLFTESRYEVEVLVHLPVGAWNFEGVAWYGARVGSAPVGPLS